MTEYFRITGLNLIPFDSQVTGAADERYRLVRGESPKGIDEPLTKEQAIPHLRNLPTEIASHILGRPGEHVMSIITFPFSIQGANDPDMEDAEHDLRETLEDGKLYIKTRGARGTEAILQVKSDNAVAQSYKTIFWGEFIEDAGREILGGAIKESYIRSLQMRLFCEAYWHPSSATNLVNAQTVRNHDDAAHNNYLDIVAANIAGDVPARTGLMVNANDTQDGFKWLLIARRSQGTVSNFQHWYEAESGSLTNWGIVADGDRSNGNIISDSANTSGDVKWSITTNALDHRGRFRVYAALYADNKDDTYFRLSSQYVAVGPESLFGWVRTTKASTWQLIYLGTLIIDPSIFPPGDTVQVIGIFLEYQKGATDTAKCDYLMLLPDDESVMQLNSTIFCRSGSNPDQIEYVDTEDFRFVGITDATNDNFQAAVFILGGPLTLQPRRDNRIYFKGLNATAHADVFADHIDMIDNDGTPVIEFDVTIDYLPQFISPLE